MKDFIKLFTKIDEFGNVEYIDEYGIEYMKLGINTNLINHRSLLESGNTVFNKGISLESALIYIGVALLLIIIGGITSGLNVSLLGLDPKKLTILEYIADKDKNDEEKKQIESIKPLIEDHHLLLTTLIVANAVYK